MGARLHVGTRWFGRREPQPIHDPLIPIRYLNSDNDAGKRAFIDAVAKAMDREIAFRERRWAEQAEGLADWQK